MGIPPLSPHGSPKVCKGSAKGAFTLLELLVAAAVFLVVVGIVLQFTDQTSKIWRGATAKIQAFQEARAGFDAMTRNLSQATLNTYYDYYNSNNKSRMELAGTGTAATAALANFIPYTYDRVSELHFISGQAGTLLAASPTPIRTQAHGVFFQAPKGYSVEYQGLANALNACGYFLQFDDGAASVPTFIKDAPGFVPKYRFRMMEMTQSTENLQVYSGTNSKNDWFVKNAAANSRVIAENVIALVLLPKLPDRQDDPAKSGKGVSLAPNYNYNSRVPLLASSDPDWGSASPSFPPDGFDAFPSGSTGSVKVTRHHQLPPVMRAVMVVLDEASAARIQGNGTTVPAAIDFSGKGLFVDATKLSEDIQKVEDVCNAKSGNITGNTQKLTYRVFSTDIIMRQAKWSNK